MLSTLYLIFLAGSFSIGYSLLRIGFPEFQEKEITQKIGMGYLVGLIVFIPSILSIFFTVEKFFFLFALGSYGFIAMVMFLVRTYYKKEETAQLIPENTFKKIPKKALTKEEQEAGTSINTKDYYKENKTIKPEVNFEDFKKEKAQELQVTEKINKINHSVTGKNEGGLIIKDPTQKKQDQGQIFKDSEPNVIEQFRKKTLGLDQKEKKEEIEKLKKLAKNINIKDREKNKEEVKKSDSSAELEELNEINEDF
jgi:hypothetical protein